MQLSKTIISGLILGAIGAISGCVSMSDPNNDNREEALARWSRCVDQRVQDYEGTPAKAIDYVFNRCDGHKRDVLATYPRHLEDRLDRMLIDKTRARTLTYLVETTYSGLVGPEAAERIETGHNDL